MQESTKDIIDVLIVEDEQIPAMYLKSIIEEDSCFKVIDTTASANETLKSIKKHKPQVVFMDVMIKGSLSGAELALKIHTLYENIKIVFLTAYSDAEMVEYATDSEAIAYILKPYHPKSIKNILSVIKRDYNKTKEKYKLKDTVKLKYGFTYNLQSKKLFKDNTLIKITPKETEFLDILCHNANRSLSKEAILELMNITGDSLRALVYRLRKNLRQDIISSSKKVGYKILTRE